MTNPTGRVLIIAGSDSSGGAGIQADIKAVTMLGGYAMTAVTAITVQDTRGVHGVWPWAEGHQFERIATSANGASESSRAAASATEPRLTPGR